ncbi:SDR family NAD(P)-dependent oxidoreductase [Pseudoalteromonas sp. MMG022]|uniref:SDR family NAD(P)-dependent oxidoreductase n=1 Tax=Pseudoalteromonas sp. MMG022 TaxID=2909978 RepID=UPI001F4177B9|nr:SDR family NAD(P)-dependent oxidoreductase [Pseudoalteromonas sp. MMG022]MCF6434834.1 SDR family NAD(P)-dependent oxidoreductase [Pseudoalteromonas sp. MMG022]
MTTANLKARLAKLSPEQRELLLKKLQNSQKTTKKETVAPVTREFDLSNAQQRMWLFEQLNHGDNAYNIVSALRFVGDFNPDAFRWSIQQLVNRNEMFRTYYKGGDTPLQVVEPHYQVEVNMLAPLALDFVKDREQVEAFVAKQSDVAFALDKLPLFSVDCVPLADGSHIIMFVIHHILADGWSLGLIEEQLNENYFAYLGGQREDVQANACQFRDFVAWEKDWLQSSSADQQRLYWKKQLHGAPEHLPMPTIVPRSSQLTLNAQSHLFQLSDQQIEGLKQLANDHQASFFMVLVATFKLALSYFSGVEDLTVGTPVANRKRAQFDGVIGMMSNTVALRSQPKRTSTFVEYLNQVKAMSLQAFANQNVPFEEVVDSLQLERSAHHSPLFQVLFALHASDKEELNLDDIQVEPVHLARKTIEFDMIFEFFTSNFNDHQVVFSYKEDLFSASMIEALTATFNAIVDYVTTSAVSDLPLAELFTPLNQAAGVVAPVANLALSAATVQQCISSLTDNASLQQQWQSLDAKLNWQQCASFMQQHLPLTAQDTVLLEAQLSPELSLLVSLWAMQVGARCQFITSVDEISDAATVLIANPATAKALSQMRTTHALRAVLVNGAQPDLDLSALGVPVYLTWSMPHCLPSVILSDEGVAYSGEVSIVNGLGEVLPEGAIGALKVEQYATGIDAYIDNGVISLLRYAGNRHDQLQAWHNGRWVECAAVRAQLLAQQGVQDALVYNRKDSNGIYRLVAYIVTNRQLSGERLYNELSQALPTHQVPHALAFVSQLPRNMQGAINFTKLEEIALFDREQLMGIDGYLENNLRTPEPISLQQLARQQQDSETQHSNDTPATSKGEALDFDTHPSNLAQLLCNAAQTDHGVTFVLNEQGETQHIGYGELLEQAKRVANGLHRAGLQAGDRVVLQLATNADIVRAFWGCLVAGMVPMPVACPDSYDSEDKDFEKIISSVSDLDIKAAICEQSNHGVLAEQTTLKHALALDELLTNPPGEVHEADSDAVTLLLLTSGSTGKPKAVQQTHHALISRSAAMAKVGQFDQNTTSFNWMPLDHVGGIVMYHLLDVYLGSNQYHCATDVILKKPLLWVDCLSQFKVNNTWAPNFAYALLNEHIDPDVDYGWDLSALHFVLNGGEAVVEKTAKRFLENLAPYQLRSNAMHPAWGMSETCSGVAVNTDFDPLNTPSNTPYVTVGGAVPGVQMRVVDGDDTVLKESQVGQLQIKGAPVTMGYLNNEEANADSFTEDGWFITGDLAVINQGQLAITGRAKDLIIINGNNYQGQEIEQVVESVEGVLVAHTAACAVRKSSDDTDKVAIFFTTDKVEEADLSELKARIQQACLRKLQVACQYFIPLEADEFPRTSIGKIQRNKLSSAFAAGEFDQRIIEFDMAQDEQYLPAWFYRPHWQRVQRGAEYRCKLDTLLICADGALAEQLNADALGVANVLAINELSQLEQALSTAKTWRVIYHAHNAQALAELLHIVQHAQHKLARLDVITHQAFSVAGEAVNTQLGGLHGFLATLRQEYPALKCTHIDVSETSTQLINELRATSANSTVALRDNTRYEYKLAKVDEFNQTQLPEPFNTDTFTLITGGMGGIGQVITQAMAQNSSVDVLLVGRRELDEAQQLQLANLSNTGARVAYQRLDITDSAALKQVISDYEQRWGKPIGSVLHLAGQLRTAMIADEDSNALNASMQAKVQGAIAIGEALTGRMDVRQIHFGSVNGYFGGSQYAAYAAANSLLEAICHSLKAQGYPAQCLHWSMWQQLGMSAEHVNSEQTRAKGYYVLTPEQGVAALRLALSTEHSTLLIGIDQSNLFISQYVAQAARATQVIASTADTLSLLPKTDDFGQRIETRITDANEDDSADACYVAGRDEPKDVITHLAQIFCDLLSLSRVRYDDNFFAIGGDSIIAIQVVARAKGVGIAIEPRQLFETQSLTELSAKAGIDEVTVDIDEFITGEIKTSAIGRWFHSLALSDPHHMNLSTMLKFKQKPDLARLEKALQAMLKHHDLLRARFDVHQVELQCEIDEQYDIALERITLEQDDSTPFAERLERVATGLQSSLNMDEGPLVRAIYLADPSTGNDRLLLVVHHLLIDGVSWRILVEDLMFYYQAPEEKALKTASYNTWIHSWEEYLDSHDCHEEVRWYLEQHQQGNGNDELAFVDTRFENTRQEEQSIEFKLDKALSEKLVRQLPAKCNLSINEVLLTTLLLAYEQWADQSSMYLMMEGHGRENLPANTPDVSRTVGWFTSLYPVRLSGAASGELSDTFRQVKRHMAAIPNQGVSFNWLRYHTADNALRDMPVPHMSFNYLGTFDVADERDISFASESSGVQTSPRQQRLYEIDFLGAMLDKQINFSIIFNHTRIARDKIQALVELWQSKMALVGEQLESLPRFNSEVKTQLQYFTNEAHHASTERLLASLTDDDIHTAMPATSTQVGLMYESLVSDTKGMYVSQLVNQLRGELDEVAFKAAWQAIVQRHSIYRTAFHVNDEGIFVQAVKEYVQVPWHSHDWTHLDAEQQEAKFSALVAEDAQTNFDIAKAPLMRINLVKLSDDCYRMLLSEHHGISDGWSRGVVLRELAQFYLAYVDGSDLTLPEAHPFADYVGWLNSQDMQAAKQFWQQSLSNAPMSKPLAGQNEATQVESIDRFSCHFSCELSTQVQTFAKQHRITVNTIAQLAWALTLSIYSDSDDVVFATTLSGRPAALEGVEEIVGAFINTVPVRIKLDKQQSIIALLQQCQQLQLGIAESDFLPLSEVLKQGGVSSVNDVINSLFVYENFPLTAPTKQPDSSLWVEWVDSLDKSEFPLSLMLIPEQQLEWVVYYHTPHFDAEAIKTMSENYQAILAALMDNSAQRLSDVSLLPTAAYAEVHKQLEQTKALTQQSEDTSIEVLEF